MRNRLVFLVVLAAAAVGCQTDRTPRPSLLVFDPDEPCAGAEVAGLEVDTGGGSTTGIIVDPAQSPGREAVHVYTLAWPPGHSLRLEDGRYVVVDDHGSVVATDGTVLTNVQVCRAGDVISVMPPPESAAPSAS